MTGDGGPTFPVPGVPGMSQRIYIATEAMKALLMTNLGQPQVSDAPIIAAWAFVFADAMLDASLKPRS